MQSTLNPKPSDDPHDVIVVAPDAVRVAPSDEQISHLLQQAARFHSEAQARNETGVPAGPPVPPVDTTFRAAAVNDIKGSGNGPSIGRRVGRPFAALLLALCVGAAAIGWQTFGYAAKKMMVKWVPQFALTTSLPLEKFWPRAQPDPPAVEPDAGDTADTAPTQAAPAVQTAAESGAANATAPAVEPAQSLQLMARDLASVSQEVEQLKASIAELKAQQTAREAVKTAEQNKVAEQNARARIAALPPRPAAPPRPHKPIAPYPPTQAYPSAQAYPPAAAPPVSQAATPYYPPRQPEPPPPAVDQLPPAPGFTSVPRPPMPVQ